MYVYMGPLRGFREQGGEMHLFQGNNGTKVWKWGEPGHKGKFGENEDFDLGQQGKKRFIPGEQGNR